ncbi:MAG TPA: PKD domain-containing protein, partial [Bacteroidales bacterium]|nr:PKD domain-containing protein [Bacteroidales bacterium]
KKDVSKVKLVIQSSSTSNIDDIRVQPIDAKVSSSSYDDAGNVTAILDNNNFAAKFEYDAAGRLISSFKETPQGFKKVSSNKYNYKRSYYYVDFTMSANAIKPGDAVTFIATDAGASNASDYNWDFGDGQSAQGKVVTHTFSGYGSATLIVNLTVKDPDNKTISVSKYLRKIDNANLVITSPKSYGTYYREETINIQWNGYSGPVDIMIGIPGSVPGGPNSPTVISNSVTGGYSWQIPSYMALGAYVITVQASDGSKSASVQINIPEKGY